MQSLTLLLHFAALAGIASAAAAPPPASMTGNAWIVVVVIFLMVVAIMSNTIKLLPVLIIVPIIFHLCGIISETELFAGLPNNGVLTVALMTVLSQPIAEVPVLRKWVRSFFEGATREHLWVTRLKLCAASGLISGVMTDVAEISVLTSIVLSVCHEKNLSVRSILMPLSVVIVLSNFSILGNGSNLVLSGLMTNAGLPAMPFFELAKVVGPQLIVTLLYCTFAPAWLLSDESKPHAESSGSGRQRGHSAFGSPENFNIQMKIQAGSSLEGAKYAQIPQNFLHTGVDVLAVKTTTPMRGDDDDARGDDEFITKAHSKFGSLTGQAGDVVHLSVPPSMLLELSRLLNGQLISANNNVAADRVAEFYASHDLGQQQQQQQRSEPTEELQVEAPVVGATPNSPLSLKRNSLYLIQQQQQVQHHDHQTPEPVAQKSMSQLSDASSTFGPPGPLTEDAMQLYTLVIAPENPFVGTTVASGEFQRRFGVSILAIRGINLDVPEVAISQLAAHTIAVADTLLVLGPKSFLRHNRHAHGNFLLIDCVDSGTGNAAVDEYVFRLPMFVPFGRVMRDGRGDYRYLIMPWWWTYVSCIIFVGIIVAGSVGPEGLATYSLYALGLYAVFGITSPESAVARINYQMYIMLAFSFPLGTAVSNSGLSNVIGTAIANAKVKGFVLHLIIGTVSVVFAALITGRAATQVLFKIVLSTYKALGTDPLPGIIVIAVTVNLGLSTLYGLPTNLIIAGPGKYSAVDFAKFGLPITIITVLLTAVLTSAIYGQW